MESLWSIATVALLFIVIYQHRTILSKNRKIDEFAKWYTLAFTDDLTGTQNHAAYSRRIKVLEKNNSCGWTLILFDIDKFKEINDTYGHLEGDKILKIFARRLEITFFGENYNVYRIGGDEFAVIAENAEEKDIISRFGELKKYELEDFSFKTSKGYAVRSSNDTFKDVFNRADQILYKEKEIKKKLKKGM